LPRPFRGLRPFPFTAIKPQLKDTNISMNYPQYIVSLFRCWRDAVSFACRKRKVKRISLDVELRHVWGYEGSMKKSVEGNKARSHIQDVLYTGCGRMMPSDVPKSHIDILLCVKNTQIFQMFVRTFALLILKYNYVHV
jgi:hypothetical protein